MKNCFDCKFEKTLRIGLLSSKELKEYHPNQYVLLEENDNFSGDLVGKCLAGFNDRMKEFRKLHGNKTRSAIENDKSLEMDCHDYSDGTKILISMNDKMDQLLEHFKNNNKDENQ